MNRDRIVELLRDGAYLNLDEDRFYHPSFRKGYRKMYSSDISFIAAQRLLGNQLVYDRESRISRLAA